MRTGLTFVLSALCATVVDARRAEACSPAPPFEFELDPAYADDTVPPSPVANVTWQVYRAHTGACGDADRDCGEKAVLSFDFDEPTDDRAPSRRLAVTLRILGDARGAYFDEWHTSGGAHIDFGDPDHDIDFMVEITVVDLNGNRSEPVVVRVKDTVLVGGCATGGRDGAHTNALAVLLASAVVAIRGRGGRRRGSRAHRA